MNTLGDIDLNLLVAFDVLMTERNVTRAAKQLGVSQPALSHTLRRLRDTFNEELFTRTVDGIEPTLRAQELHRSVAPALSALRFAIEGPVPFDLAAVEKNFIIGMPDSVALMLLPQLVPRIRATAPGVRITAVQFSPDEALRRVLDGQLDFAVGFYANSPRAGLADQILSSVQSYFGVVDRKNPHIRAGTLDRETYLSLPHVGVTLGGGVGTIIDTALETLGLQRNIVVSVPSFSIVPAVVRGTDLVGHCGLRFIEQLTYRDELLAFAPPIPLSVQRLRAVWQRRSLLNPALSWLVGLIATLVKEIEQVEAGSGDAGTVP